MQNDDDTTTAAVGPRRHGAEADPRARTDRNWARLAVIAAAAAVGVSTFHVFISGGVGSGRNGRYQAIATAGAGVVVIDTASGDIASIGGVDAVKNRAGTWVTKPPDDLTGSWTFESRTRVEFRAQLEEPRLWTRFELTQPSATFESLKGNQSVCTLHLFDRFGNQLKTADAKKFDFKRGENGRWIALIGGQMSRDEFARVAEHRLTSYEEK